MYRIEVKRQDRWIVSSTYPACYPLDAIYDAAEKIQAIIAEPMQVTRAASAIGPCAEVLRTWGLES